MNRNDYPTLNAPVPDCGGAALTPEVIDSLRDLLLSDEYQERCRQAEAERHRQFEAMNFELKRQYAASIGKSVDELTRGDMSKLNEACFQSFLRFKGVTEKDFWEWIG